MTFIMFTELLLCLLLLKPVCGLGPEITFREEGLTFEMGYCFGADYAVVYRSALDGEQLLGNTSNRNLPNTPPADLLGRIRMNEDGEVPEMTIDGLTELDSGIYRKECWQNQTVVKNHTEHLFVCKEETSPQEIVVNNEGGAQIRCTSPSVGLEGTFVRWYQELDPDYKPTLLLDSSVSLEPLIKERGLVEARESGSVLVLQKTILQTFPQFYCVVFKGNTCLGFQNIHLPDHSENTELFATKGEKVVLKCIGDSKQLRWSTPLGQINSSNPGNNQIHLLADQEPASFSLIIPVMSDEHIGAYTCIAPSYDTEYYLFLCPKNPSLKKVASIGQSISLECISDPSTFPRVQWYRQVQADLYEVIGDTYKSISIPNDLKGRVELSDSGLLTIYDLDTKDQRTYRCVVLNEFLDNAIPETTDEDGTDEDDYEDEHVDDISSCISRQDFILNFEITRIEEADTGANPDEPSHNRMPAVIGGVSVLLVLVVIVVVVVVVKKRLRVRNNNTDNTVTSRDNPDCTQKTKRD